MPIGSTTAPDRMWAPTSEPFSSTTTESSGLTCFSRIAAARPAGPGADDHHVEFHAFAFDLAHQLLRIAFAGRTGASAGVALHSASLRDVKPARTNCDITAACAVGARAIHRRIRCQKPAFSFSCSTACSSAILPPCACPGRLGISSTRCLSAPGRVCRALAFGPFVAGAERSARADAAKVWAAGAYSFSDELGGFHYHRRLAASARRTTRSSSPKS